MNRIQIVLSVLLALFISAGSFGEEYKFEISEIEKKPYPVGGYVEFRSNLFVLDKDAALYKLRLFNRDEGHTIEDYNGRLWIEGSYEKGIVGLFLKTNLGL